MARLSPDEDAPSGQESQGISKEVARALRNMAGLAVQRPKVPDGKRTTVDPAKQLAQQFPTQREFVVEVLSRMDLHRRAKRDIWYDSASGKSPKAWLRNIFGAINSVRSPDFTLPRRIEVVVPNKLLQVADLTVRFIDTKGIDRNVAREDIEVHFDDPHTLAVMCSYFNNALARKPGCCWSAPRTPASVRWIPTQPCSCFLVRPKRWP